MNDGGHLVIIGGAEERENGAKPVLQRFVELADRIDGPLFVLTAATDAPRRTPAFSKPPMKIIDRPFLSGPNVISQADARQPAT
jgi:cyanophycinase-like exopeptidase